MAPAFDLNDIRVFAVVAETSSISAAAKQMGVPISTVSRAITRLEQRLAVGLIQRLRRGVSLTDAGREYLPSCKEALQLLEVGGQYITSWKSQPSGTLKVRCPATMGWSVLAPLMTHWSASHPSLQVELLPFSPGRDPLPAEEVDIIFSPFYPENTSKAVRIYPATRRGIYASHDYVRSFGLPERPQDLRDHRCIGSREPSFAKWVLRNEGEVVMLDLKFRTLAGDPSVLKQLILDGHGISMLPIWMAKRGDVRDRVVPVLPDWKPSPVELYASYSARPAPLPQVELFLEFLAPYVGSDLDPRLEGATAAECFERTV